MKLIYRIWFIALLIKLILAGTLPLLADETYYWVWGHHLQLSYYDHPPFIAWLFAIGKIFDPIGSAVRWPTVIFLHCSLLIWISTLKKHFSERQLLYFLLLNLFNPLLGPGSLIATPDAPLLFFWSLSTYFFFTALEVPTLLYYFLFGASLGLGFCSKYTIVLFLPTILLYLTTEKLWSKIRTSGVFVTVLAGALFSLPVLIWNYQNNWDSLLYQINHGVGATHWDPKWTWQYVLGQVGILFPLIVWLSIKRPNEKSLSWLYTFSWAPLLVFVFTSFKGRVEANWPAVAYPAFMALAVANSKKFEPIKYLCIFWAVAFTIVLYVVLNPTTHFLHANIKLKEFTEYNRLAIESQKYQPFYASSFQMASVVTFKNQNQVYKLRDMGKRDFYDYQPESTPKQSPYYVGVRDWDKLPEWTKQHRVVEEIKIDEVFRIWKVELP